MKKFAAWGCVVLAGSVCLAETSGAVEFAVVGARAAGMGGAGVAATTDAFATYWNPAGLAMSRTVDVRVGLSLQGVDRLGINDTLQDIESLNKANANQAQLQALLDKINRPGASAALIGAGGAYIKGYYGEHAFGFSVADVATAGLFASQRLTATPNAGTGQLDVNGALTLRGLEARQATFSYAYAFADRTFSIGVTGKIIQGVAYNQAQSVNSGEVDIADKLDAGKTTTAFGVDVGAMYRPSSWLRLGIVAKDLNAPGFDVPGGGQFKLDPQVRSGVAVNPWESLTVTADFDFTKNKTLVPGIKSQVLSVGAEQTIFSEMLSFRIGAFKNTADANSYITPTAGLGLRLWALRADVGGGYDFRERGALVSGTVAMVF